MVLPVQLSALPGRERWPVLIETARGGPRLPPRCRTRTALRTAGRPAQADRSPGPKGVAEFAPGDIPPVVLAGSTGRERPSDSCAAERSPMTMSHRGRTDRRSRNARDARRTGSGDPSRHPRAPVGCTVRTLTSVPRPARPRRLRRPPAVRCRPARAGRPPSAASAGPAALTRSGPPRGERPRRRPWGRWAAAVRAVPSIAPPARHGTRAPPPGRRLRLDTPPRDAKE